MWFSLRHDFKSITFIPGILDHDIVLADYKLKLLIITKPRGKICQWSKADWRSIREQTVVFAEDFLSFWLQQLPEVLMKTLSNLEHSK